MSPYDQIRNARNAFGFAMFLHEAANESRITPGTFVKKLVILTSEAGQRDEGFAFEHKYDQAGLIDLTYNQVVASMSICAIAADAALDDSLGPKGTGATQDVIDLRDLIYMIRCACAHDPMSPGWKITKPKYQREYSILGARVKADLRALNGHGLVPDNFGGWQGFLGLMEEAMKLASKIPPP